MTGGAEVEQLKRGLVEHLVANIPFYRTFKGAFDHLPIVSKRMYVKHPNAFLDQSSPYVEEISQRLYGIRKFLGQYKFNEELIVEQTSGSTGIPFQFVKSSAERLRMVGGMWERRRAVDPLIKSSNYVAMSDLRRSAVRIGLTSDKLTIFRAWSSLNERGARWLQATPTVLRLIIDAVRRYGNGSELWTVKFLESTGQHLDENLRSEARIVVGAECVDQYATREVWTIATASKAGAMQVLTDNVIVEILDENGCAVPDGAVGEIVVTSFHQRLMPFVRFRTGDRGFCQSTDAASQSLTLAAHRQHHYIIGAAKQTVGAELFKTVIKRAYMETGLLPITYLKIEQTTASRFAVFINSMPSATHFVSLIERITNAIGDLGVNVQFRAVELSESEIDRKESALKAELFTSAAMLR